MTKSNLLGGNKHKKKGKKYNFKIQKFPEDIKDTEKYTIGLITEINNKTHCICEIISNQNELQNVICSTDKKVGMMVKNQYVLMFVPYREMFHKNRNKKQQIKYRSRIIMKLDDKSMYSLVDAHQYNFVTEKKENNEDEFIHFENKIITNKNDKESEEENKNQIAFDIDNL